MTDFSNTLEERLRVLEARLAMFESQQAIDRQPPVDATVTVDTNPKAFGTLRAAVDPEATHDTDDRIGRRHLLRKAGAVAAGAVALQAWQQDRAAAADGGDLVIGASNTASTTTRLTVGPDIATDVATFGMSIQANGSSIVNALVAAGSNVGVSAGGARIGVIINSATSHLRLNPSVNVNTAGANLLRGELRVDTAGNMWFQHTDGVGNAQKIAGPAAAGAFHVVDPFRIYDSRTPGILAAGQARPVPVTTAAGSPVPVGAKAIVATLTLTGTQGNFGFLTITAGDIATTTASSINWFGPDQSLAATVVSKLDAAGGVKIFNNSPNATNFILDVTGYYR